MKSLHILALGAALAVSGFAQLSVSGTAPVGTPDTAPAAQTITALAGTAQVSLAGQPGAGVTLTGTWTATLTPELSMDSGATWVATFFRIPSTGQNVPTVPANGSYSIVVSGGASHARIRASAFTSGTISALLRAGQAVPDLLSSTGTNITTATTTAVKGTAGVLRRVVVGTSVASATIKLFNVASVACTGTPGSGASGVITLPATVGNPFSIELNQTFSAGICVVTSGATNVSVIFD
jgi:hypothetical protein